MKNILKVIATDAKRIASNVVAVVIIIGLCILPCLYAWFNIFSNWDPYGPDATKNISVAVISLDQGANIAGLQLNIGESVVEALETNTTIGWVFTETLDDTIEGVESGDFYAALVMPENFTQQMISFINGEIENPEIIYYENEKKNAIAPKITQKAQKAVKEQVNSTFVSTLAETILKVTSSVTKSSPDGTNVAGTLVDKLDELSEEMSTYITVLDTTELMLPNAENITGSTGTALESMKSVTGTAVTTANSVDSMIISAFDLLDSTVTTVANVTNTATSSIGAASDSVLSGINGAQALVPYAKELFNTYVSGFADTSSEEVKNQIATTQASFDKLNDDMMYLGQRAAFTKADLDDINSHIQTDVATCQNGISQLRNSYVNQVSPQVKQTINATSSAINSAIAIADTINTDYDDLYDIIDNYQDTVENGTDNLSVSLELATELLDAINTLKDNLQKVSESERYATLVDLMEKDPTALGEFISSPVRMETERIYPIDNYGSAMAPFYSILAIWVGSLILVAIIHVHVHPVPGVKNLKPYQAYFGRYVLFFAVGQIQALITVLGDLHFIGIQCEHPFMFWFACSVCSFVFTIFIYSLTVAFGNVGEALAVVVMVIQVAGAGCTFPIETLPKVFQNIYDYLPFQFGMNAMKEAIAGTYENDYWIYILKIGVYVIISLIIGLALAIPCRKLNKIIEKDKEKSGIMI